MSTALLDALARYLADLGHGTYDPTGAAMTGPWPIFPDQLPQEPDECIALFTYRGPAPDPSLPHDETRLQVRVRGTADPRVSRARADLIYGALHGLGPVALHGGLWAQLVLAIQSGPESIGPDTSERHEHVCNFEISWVNPTAHRPAL